MFVNLHHFQKEILMSTPDPINLGEYTAVQVVIAGKAFTYKAPAKMAGSLEPRTPVVVDFGSKGLSVGIVESVGQVPCDPQAKFKYKWIVAAIDRAPYDAILAAEAAGTQLVQ